MREATAARRGWREALEQPLARWVDAYGSVFAALMLVQIAAYSYFYTVPTLTDHIFPNSWLSPYPSYKTWGEGRWLADLLIRAQGGSGVQSFQMICATALQALNGILLARLAGLTGRLETLGIAALLCLYPAFLDYYSFAVDHITFVLGDTLAIAGAYGVLKPRTAGGVVIWSTPFLVMAMAAYPPKIAVVSFLVAAALLLRLSAVSADSSHGVGREAIKLLLGASAALVVAVGLYWLTAQLLVGGSSQNRVHVNTPREAFRQVLVSYPATLSYFTSGAVGIPGTLQFLPAAGIMLGAASILLRAGRRAASVLVMSFSVLAFIPIALRAPYIVNSFSFEDAGRILAAHGYCLAFFLACGLRTRLVRVVNAVICAVCLYFFILLAIQESNAAAFKSFYEAGMINRIAARAESILGELQGRSRALVVAGHYPDFDLTPYVRYRQGVSKAHLFAQAFQGYRQVEMLNFVMGRAVFRRPTPGEIDRAVRSMKGRPPWPAPQSIYLLDDIMVVMLETYRPNMSLTWPAR